MWTITEIKAKGKEAFQANYWKSVLVAFILNLIAGGGLTLSSNSGSTGSDQDLSQAWNGMPQDQQMIIAGVALGAIGLVFVISLILKIFVFNPLEVGAYGFFRDNVSTNGGGDLNVLKSGFSNFGRTFATLFLRDLFLCLWTMLFIIPGLIKAYSYRMVPYIVRDNPELSGTEVITRSRQMMDGNKGRAFLLDLSFIGWILLGLITCGLVLVLWTRPYMENTNAALYLELSGQGEGYAADPGVGSDMY